MPKRKRVRAPGFTPVANPARAAAMRALRASNAAGLHEDRRTRAAGRRAAIADQLRRRHSRPRTGAR